MHPAKLISVLLFWPFFGLNPSFGQDLNIYLPDSNIFSGKLSVYQNFEILKKNFNRLADLPKAIQIKSETATQSPHTKHERFGFYKDGYKIDQSAWSIHSSKDGVPYHSKLILPKNLPFNVVTTSPQITGKAPGKYSNTILSWKETDGAYSLLIKTHFTPPDGRSEELWLDESGNILGSRSLHTRMADSTVKALVHLPDPLTTSGMPYGGAYIDNADIPTNEINNERFERDLHVDFRFGQFVLENEYVTLVDKTAPNHATHSSAFPNMFFVRSQHQFEQVNVLYHTYEMVKRTEEYGHNLVKEPLKMDAHAWDGDDFSAFDEADTSIGFGVGGVDDAEDADVIIHELSHALAFLGSPFTNLGNERRALDEAMADYLASSYSVNLSTYDYQKVFNWDGNIEAWGGRQLDNENVYPDDLGGNDYYQSSLIFSALLVDLMDIVGRDVVDQLVFELYYNLDLLMTLEEAAFQLAMADSNVFTSAYRSDICSLLKERGLMDCDTVFRPKNISTESIVAMEGIVPIDSRIAWLFGEQKNFEVELFNTGGQLIARGVSSDPFELRMDFNALSPGIYLMKISGDIQKSLPVLVIPGSVP